MSSNTFNSYTGENSFLQTRAYPYHGVGRTFDFVCQGQDAQPTVQEGDEAFQPRDGDTSVVRAAQVRRLGLDRC